MQVRPRAPQHWLPTAPGVFTTVCVHLDGSNAEHKFQVWVTILGHTSLPFPFPLIFLPHQLLPLGIYSDNFVIIYIIFLPDC